jgi:hypothetical protein
VKRCEGWEGGKLQWVQLHARNLELQWAQVGVASGGVGEVTAQVAAVGELARGGSGRGSP